MRGYPIGHPNRYALQLLAVVLGGGMSSRLFTEVREKRGLGYYVHAGEHGRTRTSGTFYSSAGVDVERVDEAITTILGELRKIAAEPVPADELEKARGYAKGRFVLRLESPQGTIQYGLRREVLEGEIEEPDELLRQLDEVTVEDVQRVAKDLFEDKRLYLALVGPVRRSRALREAARGVSDERELLRRTAEIAGDFLDSLDERPVFPRDSMEDIADGARRAAPGSPTDPLEVVELMAREIDRGVVATAGPRYFGYVTGSALPATVAADWLTTIWDQCAGLGALGPSASVVEEIVGEWLKDIFGLPPERVVRDHDGLPDGARHVPRRRAAPRARARGWDVREGGLAGSPPITVVVGALRHVTVDRALRLLGIGSAQLVVVRADDARADASRRPARGTRRRSTARRSCARRPAR